MTHTLSWFKNRVGKTIHRSPIKFCPCKSCQATEVKITDEAHAEYIFNCQHDLGIDYRD